MKFTREEHIAFLELELKEQTEQYIAKIQTSAIALFEKEEVFSTQFVKFENGQLILKFKNERSLPRKGDYLTALVLQDDKKSFKTWGNLTWADLRKNHQIEYTEVVCIWHSSTEDSKFSFVGFKGVSLEFSEKLVDKCIVVLGPKEPPYQYIQNLIKVVKDTPIESESARILDFDEINNNWSPKKITETKNIESLITNQLSISKEVIIQGPPGTGKTYLMGQISANLLSKGKSVLVTSLTNRALIELAIKPALEIYLSKGKVHKTKLSTDEKSEVPNLENSKEIVCSPGNLALSTFFITSGLASETPTIPPFDYVIMDEASQSLLAMVCASKLLGKHIIWIGDPVQLPPIVLMNTDKIKKRSYNHLINGMITLINNLSIPSFQLTNSYRLTKRSVEYTGLFYDNNLKSKSSLSYNLKYPGINEEVSKFMNPDGGPTLIKTKMPIGEACPDFATHLVINIVYHLLKGTNKKLEIAVLTKLKKTVKKIQKDTAIKLGSNKNIIIETIERVQGLTTDITIFFIPNSMQDMSLNEAIFNVATSRAKGQTIIIADENILNYPFIDNKVKKYLTNLNEEYSFTINPNTKQLKSPR